MGNEEGQASRAWRTGVGSKGDVKPQKGSDTTQFLG